MKDDSNGRNARESSKRGGSQSAESVIGGMCGKHDELEPDARRLTSDRSCFGVRRRSFGTTVLAEFPPRPRTPECTYSWKVEGDSVALRETVTANRKERCGFKCEVEKALKLLRDREEHPTDH